MLEKIGSPQKMLLQKIMTAVLGKQVAHVIPWPLSRELTPDETIATRQMLLFFKPEVFLPGVATQDIMSFGLDLLKTHGYLVSALSVFPGSYLQQQRIMERHYGKMNEVFRAGTNALSAKARAKFQEVFKIPIEEAKVYGGQEALSLFGWSPEDQDEIAQQVVQQGRLTKLDSGQYVHSQEVNGQVIYLLNDFHWGQLNHYYSGLVVAMCIEEEGSSSNWQTMRRNFAGATNPAEAALGSFRKLLLERQLAFGLGRVDMGFNGLHLSAGPIEAAVELMMWFDLAPEQTVIGQLLLARGFSQAEIQLILSNPRIDGQTLFGLTEDQEPAATVIKLGQVRALFVSESPQVFMQMAEKEQTKIICQLLDAGKEDLVRRLVEEIGKACSFNDENLLVLASTSPRRQAILKDMGVGFITAKSTSEEFQPQTENPMNLVKTLAIMKLLAFMRNGELPGKTILSCDTLIILPNGKIIGKPQGADREAQLAAARKLLLEELPGIEQRVVTGLVCYDAATNSLQIAGEHSSITLRPNEGSYGADVEAFINSEGDRILGRAGAWGTDNPKMCPLVAKMEGDPSGLVGFPAEAVRRVLEQAGIQIC